MYIDDKTIGAISAESAGPQRNRCQNGRNCVPKRCPSWSSVVKLESQGAGPVVWGAGCEVLVLISGRKESARITTLGTKKRARVMVPIVFFLPKYEFDPTKSKMLGAGLGIESTRGRALCKAIRDFHAEDELDLGKFKSS